MIDAWTAPGVADFLQPAAFWTWSSWSLAFSTAMLIVFASATSRSRSPWVNRLRPSRRVDLEDADGVRWWSQSGTPIIVRTW